MFRLVLGFIAGSLVARTLGAEGFGQLSFAMAIYLLLEPISQLGLQNLYKKEYLENIERRPILLITTLLLRILFSLFIGLILSGYAYFYVNNEVIKSILYLFSSLFLFKSFEIVEWTKEAELQLKKLTLLKFIVFFVVFSLRLYGVYLNKGIQFFAFIFFIEYLLFFIVFFIWLVNKKYKIIFSKEIAKIIIKKCWPLICSSLAVTVYMKIDQLMIQKILDSKNLGIYSASVRISEIFNFFPLVVSTVLFPLWFSKDSQPRRIIIQSFSLMTIPSLLISFFVFIFSTSIIQIIYGPGYEASAQILRCHIFSMIFVFWGVMVSNYDIYINRTQLSMYRTFLGAISNIFLNLILIPKYGAMGAAIGTLISYGLTVVVFNFFFSSLRPLNLILLKTFNPKYFWEIIYESYQGKN